MGIGNGSAEGDEKGEWTQVGQRGSTIDYVIRNDEGRRKIYRMWIGDRIKSDHLPIEQRIKWTGESGTRMKQRNENGAVKRVVRWNEESAQDFKNKVIGHSTSWTEMKEKIQRAIPRIMDRGCKERKEEKWWDAECHEKKRELRESLRSLKRGEIEEKEWRNRRREYRYFIEGKKRSKDREWLEDVEKDKGMKLFWKAVSAGKRKSARVDKSITNEQWKEHFRVRYIIGDIEEGMATEEEEN